MMWILYFLPKNYLSYVVGKLMHIPYPRPIGPWLIKMFAKTYKINLSEAEKPIEDYKSIGDLFVRKLKDGLRIPEGEIVHPVDGVISQHGKIQHATLVQAKGKTYKLDELLKSDEAKAFEGGTYITYYLCPTDYHRIHSPVSGDITHSILIPGKLWPVNTWSVETIKNLFAINERIVTFISTEKGRVAVVKVGATNVGQISLSYDNELRSNVGVRTLKQKSYQPSIAIRAGEELGCFHMGSTVIVLFDQSMSSHLKEVKSGPSRVGERLGR